MPLFIRWYLFGSLVIYNHFGWCLDQQAVLLRRIGLFSFGYKFKMDVFFHMYLKNLEFYVDGEDT